ncbi:hypothetical protein EAM01S_03_00590 [Erwinia amylovora NBRC 12687 = CFBP 1232]|nr:hypothetical protein EAM01S_03_00590 [Erwinia amylovora NBRC 12687 = CFBP 1232]
MKGNAESRAAAPDIPIALLGCFLPKKYSTKMLSISLKKSVIKAIAPILGETRIFTMGPESENQPNPLETTNDSANE